MFAAVVNPAGETAVNVLSAGLKNPTLLALAGTNKTRPSGNSTPPQYSLDPFGPLTTFPKTGTGAVTHHPSLGCDAALHVAEIQFWIKAALSGDGKRCGYLFVKSSPYRILPDATMFVVTREFEM